MTERVTSLGSEAPGDQPMDCPKCGVLTLQPYMRYNRDLDILGVECSVCGFEVQRAVLSPSPEEPG